MSIDLSQAKNKLRTTGGFRVELDKRSTSRTEKIELTKEHMFLDGTHDIFDVLSNKASNGDAHA